MMCDALGRLGVRTPPRPVERAEAQPIASNATAAGGARNRRVEVTLTHRHRRR
jgi:hypothetical protein